MFVENKWYKFVGDKEEFLEMSTFNAKIYGVISKRPFKVISCLGPSNSVYSILVGGDKIVPDDINSSLSIIISGREYRFFEEIGDYEVFEEVDEPVTSDKVVLVQILDGKATPSIPLSESDANESIEVFLRNNPKGKVDVYSFSKTASMGVTYN